MSNASQAAGDAELYDPAPPPGAAFVRVMNGGAGPAPAAVGDRKLGTVAVGDASAYVVVQARAAISAGAATGSVEVQPGEYRTAVYTGDAVTVVVDPPSPPRTKAMVALYNLSGAASLSLTTADGGVSILTDVGAGAVAGRPVNPVALSAAVSGGAAPLALPERILERGVAYAVVVTGPPDALRARWVAARTDTSR